MAIPIPLHRKPLISCKITWSSRSISWCFKFYSYVEIYVSGMYIAEDVGILKCWFPLYGCSWSSHVCRFISHFCWLNSHVCRSKSNVCWEIRFHQQMSKKSSAGCVKIWRINRHFPHDNCCKIEVSCSCLNRPPNSSKSLSNHPISTSISDASEIQ